MRVVMLTPGHAEVGGAARRARAFADGLAARGHQVRVVTRSGSTRRPVVRRSTRLTVVEVPGFGRRRAGALLYYAVALPLALLWGRRATYVGFQLMSTATVAAVAALLRRRPLVLLSTTSGALSEMQYLRATRSAPFRLRLLGRADRLVVQTQAAVTEYRALVPEPRIVVLPTPVAAVQPAPLDGRPRAVFTGRLSEEKDLPTLLRAWRAAAPAEACLELVGDDGAHRPVGAVLRSTVAQDEVLRRTVRFVGWVDDVRPHLLAADVYVFPSLSEGMSNALLEACALGRVVVASDIPPNVAILGPEHPLLYPAGDQQALEAALRAALLDPVVRAAAVASVLSRMPAFTLDTVVSGLEETLRAAARGPRHQHA